MSVLDDLRDLTAAGFDLEAFAPVPRWMREEQLPAARLTAAAPDPRATTVTVLSRQLRLSGAGYPLSGLVTAPASVRSDPVLCQMVLASTLAQVERYAAAWSAPQQPDLTGVVADPAAPARELARLLTAAVCAAQAQFTTGQLQLRQHLTEAQVVRRYAVEELALPDEPLPATRLADTRRLFERWRRAVARGADAAPVPVVAIPTPVADAARADWDRALDARTARELAQPWHDLALPHPDRASWGAWTSTGRPAVNRQMLGLALAYFPGTHHVRAGLLLAPVPAVVARRLGRRHRNQGLAYDLGPCRTWSTATLVQLDQLRTQSGPMSHWDTVAKVADQVLT